MLMPLLLAALLPAAQDAPAAPAPPPAPWLELSAARGPGAGRHIVLVSGDEEYRSEEALPMLAQVLAQRHGFRCTVLFAIDTKDGTVNPEERANIPGLQALDDADLLVLFTRFRCLPDADMQHLVDYVRAGKPVIGIRTATHAFAYDAESTSQFKGWSWDSATPKGGFGQELFGTTWVAHLGNHGHESTRGVVPEGAAKLPMLRGVHDVWGPTDVYAVPPLPADTTVLLEGSILSGMTPDSVAVDDPRNAPRTPVTWIREIVREGGGRQRVACSTIGAAVDLKCEDLRRLFVNLCYWGVGLEKEIPEQADVTVVGTYEPTMFGFGGYRKGLKPGDLLGQAAAEAHR
ncbi:MAG TPA: hypothetical protein VFY71_09135 [Planctomycetota bacterium]|nr:hypothetical protein [Planctomycetota bacterium]